MDYVYVPWQSPEYTTENFTNFVTVMSYLSHKPYGGRIIPYGFGNLEAINYCKEFFPDNMPVTVRHLFENERPEVEEIHMTWSETYNLPHRPKPPKPHCPLMPHHHHHHPPMPVHKTGWIPGPPPPMGEPFWQGPAYHPPFPHRPRPIKPRPVDNDYENPSVIDIAVSEIMEVCPGFESWVQACDIGCEECPLKSYIEPPTSNPSENDPTNPGTGEGDLPGSGAPSDENPNESGNNTDPEAPTDTEPKPGVEEPSKDPSTGEETPPESETPVTGEENGGTESGTSSDARTGEATPGSTEETVDPIETATSLMS